MNSLKYVVSKAVKKDPIMNDLNETPLLTPIEIDRIVRKVTLTEWFLNPVQGQPRYVDIYRLRALARSEWVATVITFLLNRIKPINYEIVAKDPKKRSNPSTRIQNEIRQAERLFEEGTPNGKSFKRVVESPFFRDILELDAGVIVKQFTEDSYEGDPKQKGSLKVRSKRTLGEIVAGDGGSFLKDVRGHYVLNGYFQYSYTRPTAAPVFFDRDEVAYTTRYPRSYNPYGWAPTQNADAILNSLINSAVWNNNFFSGQGIPRGMITIDGDDQAVRRFRAYWRQKIKGKWYSMPVVNREAKWVPFSLTAKDMEWLSGQKWYQRMICILYQVHPAELGIEDTSRQGGVGAETRDRIQRQSSIVPLLLLGEEVVNADILTEISPRIKFRYVPEDPAEAQQKANMENSQVENGLKTINEIRTIRGEGTVPWGDLPPALLNNLVRSWSRLGTIPNVNTMNKLNFAKVKIPEKKTPSEEEENVFMKSIQMQNDISSEKLKILRKIGDRY